MRVVIRQLTKKEAIIDVHTNIETKTLTIKKINSIYSYDKWEMQVSQYYRLKDFIEMIIEVMEESDEADELNSVVELEI